MFDGQLFSTCHACFDFESVSFAYIGLRPRTYMHNGDNYLFEDPYTFLISKDVL